MIGRFAVMSILCNVYIYVHVQYIRAGLLSIGGPSHGESNIDLELSFQGFSK